MGTGPEPRRALLAVEHPLNHTQKFQDVKPQTSTEKLEYLFERKQIEDVLNTYGYRLDTVMVRPEAVESWVDVFTDDCELTYPFGTHHGKEDLGKWCLNAETRFKRMLHMSSNFTIKFESETVAHGRSTLMATCGLHDKDIGQCFFEGGYYYWSFRKEGDEWKISYLFLDAVWTSGDSLGLNDLDYHSGSGE